MFPLRQYAPSTPSAVTLNPLPFDARLHEHAAHIAHGSRRLNSFESLLTVPHVLQMRAMHFQHRYTVQRTLTQDNLEKACVQKQAAANCLLMVIVMSCLVLVVSAAVGAKE